MTKLAWGLVLVLLLSGCLSSLPAGVGSRPQSPASDTVTASKARAEKSTPAVDLLPRPEQVSVTKPDFDPVLTAILKATLLAPVPAPVADFIVHRPPLQYTGDIEIQSHPRVDTLVAYYTGPGRIMFGHWLERAGKHIPRIQMVFASQGLPLDLAYLAMIESGFNEKAYSWAHAAGPWQFIESTGRHYGLDNNWWLDERRDIEKSTRAAADFLKDLSARFENNWYLAIAAYNAGGGKISQAMRAAKSDDFWQLAAGNVLRAETKNYVPKLLAALTIVRDLESYGFTELDFEYQPKYELVTLPTTTDLEVVAKLSGAEYAEIKALNPELKRWCTPPNITNYPLRVPAGRAALFHAAYAELPVAARANYYRHRLAAGDTLGSLAKKYHIEIDDIIQLNRIQNPRTLQIGADLILPLRQGFTRLPVDELADDYQRSRRRQYRVRAGDSLWKIAQRFNVSEKELRVWNRLGWSNLLRPGQVLAVSGAGRKKVATTASRRESRPLKKMVYRVRPGDTLWGIGRQFDVKMQQIRTWNELGQSHLLQPGQKLTLHVAAT